jgi:hypothetical protein
MKIPLFVALNIVPFHDLRLKEFIKQQPPYTVEKCRVFRQFEVRVQTIAYPSKQR